MKDQKTGTQGPTLGMGQQRGHLVLLLPPNFEFQSVLRTPYFGHIVNNSADDRLRDDPAG